jgi:hypothetical protein
MKRMIETIGRSVLLDQLLTTQELLSFFYYKCYEKYRKFLIYGLVMFCWRQRGKATIFISIIPLIFPLFPNYLDGDGMRNGGKVVIVHILFSVCLFIFCCLAIFPFPPKI